ncbi:MAG: xanthine dehydrogenase family protein subunit M [Bryobacterales bacterium]
MFPAEFDYVRAGSEAEIAELLATHADAKILAGGHSLIPILKLRLAMPATLIDIGRVPSLKGISVNGDVLRIGALTTHAEIATSAEVRKHAPALAEAAGVIGDPAVRNRGTIGGNVAHADPASDLPSVLTAFAASIHVTGPSGARIIAAEEFFEGLMATALRENELLTAVELPLQSKGQASAYEKLAHPASRYAVIGVAAVLTAEEGKCTSARVVLGGLTPAPTRAAGVETALQGGPLTPEAIANAAAQTAAGLGDDLLGDLYASAEYRKAVAHVYVRRALETAAGRLA